jgi:hypothetical protein
VKRSGFKSKVGVSAGARHVGLARTPMKRSPRKATDDPAHLALVRTLPCSAIAMDGHHCDGPKQAHHAGRHGVGMRCPDRQAICLCMAGHSELHELRGPFKNWRREQVREWEDVQILCTLVALGLVAP